MGHTVAQKAPLAYRTFRGFFSETQSTMGTFRWADDEAMPAASFHGLLFKVPAALTGYLFPPAILQAFRGMNVSPAAHST